MGEMKVEEINPRQCYFVVAYPDGKMVKGNALSETAWNQIPSQLSTLKFKLSNNVEVDIPEHKAYSIEVDAENDVYYAINVLGLSDDEIVVYRINLRQVEGSALKIGHVILGNLPVPKELDESWKYKG